MEMSKHKFASNVIEKCLRFGGPQEQHLMVNEILTFASGSDTLQVYNFYLWLFDIWNYSHILSHAAF